jgi:hypothetical protein
MHPQIPRGEPAALCFKAGLSYIEQNQLKEAILCLDEAFLSLAKERSLGSDVKPQARIIAQYKIAVQLLQVINPFFSCYLRFHFVSFCTFGSSLRPFHA